MPCCSRQTSVAKLLSTLALCPTLACTSPGASSDGGEEESEGSDGTESTGDPDPGSSGSEGSSSGDEEQPPQDVPARGLTIAKVEANPAVAIPIAQGGQWVDGSGRNAPIPKLRNTAFRVYVDVDESVWVLREIEARLTVFQADGTTVEYRETAEIGTDSSVPSLQSNILLGVLAKDMRPGAKFQVELYEVGSGYEALPAASMPPRAVESGPALIGIEGSTQNMRIVLVPIDYSHGSCTTTIDTSEEVIARYENAMFQQNPLESIELKVREPYSVTDLDLGTSDGFFGLLARIAELRAQDNPDPNVYYYGLFDNCDECISDGDGCLLGVASGKPGASMSDASERAAIGTQFLSGDEVGIETFVHEIGHSQGRAHVACPGGQAAGPDPSYPHENGKIGVWGFGVRDFQIRGATTYVDYMSYCNPAWVSDWQWTATFQRIKTLSAWDMADKLEPDPSAVMLVGAMNPETGESRWWTDRGVIEDSELATASSTVAFFDGSSLVEEVSADVDAWTEGPWVTVRANLPRTPVFERVQAFELRTPSRTERVDRARITLRAQ